MADDVLVTCKNVSKKFCRGIKRSLWYGMQDICAELNPIQSTKFESKNGHLQMLRKDEFWAVSDVSFELKRGECLGLIGHNGAGKSTLLKMLNGLIKPDRGKITMKGRIGALIELNAGFNPILTGRENVYIYGSILGFTKKEIDKKYNAIVDFSEMHDFMEMPFRSYSSGMKVRLGFAVASQMEPDVLIIDEVLAVGDANFRQKCLQKISSIMANAAVVFVSHDNVMHRRISSKGILLEKGTCKIQGNIDSVIHTYNRSNQPSSLINQYSCFNSGLSFWVANETFYPPKRISFGDPIAFSLNYEAKSIFTNCLIVITFSTKSKRVLQTHTSGTFMPGKGVINLSISRINLSSGEYELSLTILSEKGRLSIAAWLNFHVIKITGKINYGIDYQEPLCASISQA